MYLLRRMRDMVAAQKCYTSDIPVRWKIETPDPHLVQNSAD